MDIRKVFDQTVRDLRREVNKKVLKVPEIEQKVLDATSNEPWGPHGTLMSEIAQATRNYTEYQLIMSVLWRRLADTGRNWRHVYKALTVVDFIVAHGSEKAVDDITEHVFQIQGLTDFQYEEPGGKDQGVNVRKKAQALIALLNDKDKIREARQKAISNKNKYQGISSTGGKFSSSGRGYSDSNDWRYDGNGRYDEKFGYGGSAGKYVDNDRYRDDWHSSLPEHDDDDPDVSRDVKRSPAGNGRAGSTTRHEEPVKSRDVRPANTPLTTLDDDDDFNPRASSAPPAAPPPPKPEVDFFSQTAFFASTPPVADDLFAAFQSAPEKANPAPPDLFATDLFVESRAASDPFAALSSTSTSVPTAAATDFGAFASAPSTTKPVSDPLADDPFGTLGSFQQAEAKTLSTFEDSSFGAFQGSVTEAKTQPPPVTTHQKFETKSSIWSDPLSAELINLNLGAPKGNSNALADLGIQLQSSDWTFEEKKPQQAKAMGSGTGLGLAAASNLSPPPPATGTSAAGGYDFFSMLPVPNVSKNPDPFAA